MHADDFFVIEITALIFAFHKTKEKTVRLFKYLTFEFMSITPIFLAGENHSQSLALLKLTDLLGNILSRSCLLLNVK